MSEYIVILPLLIGWGLDFFIGDPERLPHPIVWFGRLISFFEKRLNRGKARLWKGAVCSVVLILFIYFASKILLGIIANAWIRYALEAVLIFYCLAGTTLVKEVRNVFLTLDISLDAGRKQVSRIVGRDTSHLSAQEIRTAALETLAENLSDGVIAPLFWYAILGVPGMLAYKMVNTLDSMIGYRNDRYKDYGCIAARIDDIANFIPARITAFLMIMVAGKPGLMKFVMKYGREHLSPNSGYPEAALAGILDCRFGGTHNYFGKEVYKPYIGNNPREITTEDMWQSVKICRTAEAVAVLLVLTEKILLQGC